MDYFWTKLMRKRKKIKLTKSPDAFIAENWVKKNGFCVTNEEMTG